MSNPAKSLKLSSPKLTVVVSARITVGQRAKLSAISKAWNHKNVSETVSKAVLDYMERKRKR